MRSSSSASSSSVVWCSLLRALVSLAAALLLHRLAAHLMPSAVQCIDARLLAVAAVWFVTGAAAHAVLVWAATYYEEEASIVSLTEPKKAGKAAAVSRGGGHDETVACAQW